MQQAGRMVVAACAVGAICVAPFGADALVQAWQQGGAIPADAWQQQRQGESQGDAWYGLPSGYAPEDNMVQDLFERLGGWAATPAPVPESFEREVLAPSAVGAAEVVVGEDTVGFVVDLPQDLAQAAVTEALTSRGWERVGISQAGWSYVKQDGSIRWANLSWASMGDSTTVVVAYREEREKDE